MSDPLVTAVYRSSWHVLARLPARWHGVIWQGVCVARGYGSCSGGGREHLDRKGSIFVIAWLRDVSKCPQHAEDRRCHPLVNAARGCDHRVIEPLSPESLARRVPEGRVYLPVEPDAACGVVEFIHFDSQAAGRILPVLILLAGYDEPGSGQVRRNCCGEPPEAVDLAWPEWPQPPFVLLRHGGHGTAEVGGGRGAGPDGRAKRGGDRALWCRTPELLRTTKKPRAAGLGLSCGAGDENRTRALSLGISGAWLVKGTLTCSFGLARWMALGL